MSDRLIPTFRTLRRWLALAAGAATLLVGCGGGTSQVDPFIPERLITFGDESGLLVASGDQKGRHYGMNGLDSDAAFNCTLLPTWSQWLASHYGFVFEACPGTATEFKAVQRAESGVGAEQLAAQVQAQIDGGGFTTSDLAAVMVGTKDIIDTYERIGVDLTQVQAEALLAQRGELVAAQVNRMVDLGVKVIVSTVPRIDHTPYGVAKETGTPGQAKVLRTLSESFNGAVRFNIVQDGSLVGLVLADDLVLGMFTNPTNYALTDVKQAACSTASVLDCLLQAVANSTVTPALTVDSKISGYLWADDRHLGVVAQRQIGLSFVSRAANNPF